MLSVLSPRGSRSAICLAYLLGTAVSLLHPLKERSPFDGRAGLAPGRTHSLRCDSPACPDPSHGHHHHGGSSHDPSRCASCQGNPLIGAALTSQDAPTALAIPEDVAPLSSMPPALPAAYSHRTRAPPSA